MRTIARALVLSLAAAFAASASCAAPMGGGGARGGGGVILPGGGGGASGGGAPNGATGGKSSFAAPRQGSARSGVAQSGQTGFADRGGLADGAHWRHHHGYWPGAVYGYGYNYGGDYENEPDINQCLVYRKIYNARGLFVGWRQVNVCTG